MELQLDDWQKEVLKYKGDFILCTGRQIGKTTIMAIKAAEYMVRKPNSRIIIVSLTEDQAKLIINMVLSYLEIHYKKLIAKGQHKPTQNKVTLTNKSMALARPVGNSGDAMRGFTGDVLIIDEGARFPELAFISAEPTLLSTGGEVWMASTPYGKRGYFWEQYNAALEIEDGEVENDMGWKVWHINGEETITNRPISPSWTEEKRVKSIHRLKKLRQRWSELRYGQEILALFMDDLQRFFEEKLIQDTCILKRPQSVIPSTQYYMGNDLARMGGDYFTAEILQIAEGKTIRHVENISANMLLTTTNESIIVELTKKWQPVKIGIDAGAGTLGVSILDHLLINPLTKRKVVAMNNRKVVLDRDETKQRIFKEDMYDNFRAMLEHRELLLLDDDNVKTSLRSVQIELNTDQYGTNKVKIYGIDTHIVEGLVRAAWLAKKEKSKNFFIRYM